MRLLVVTKDFPAPGQPEGGIVVFRQALALAELGHELLVARIVPHAPPVTAKWRAYRAIPERYAIGGIPVETLRAVVPPRMLAMEYLPWQIERQLGRIVARFGPHVAHAHYVIPCGHVAVRQPVPTVITAHGSDAYDWAWRRPGLRRAAAAAVREARAVVAVSEFIRAHVRKLYEREVLVVPNGADEATFAPRDRIAARRELGIDEDRFVVAFAGRATREKGAHDLADAVAALHDLRPLAIFAGPQTAEFERSVAARGVDARMAGMLDHASLARVLAAADAFALPSYREGLPLAVCEAMLCARAVVATPVGGIPEIVVDGQTGFLVPPARPDRLAERLRLLANDRALAERIGATAFDYARAHLTWRVNARRYDELYRALAGATA